MKQFEYSNPTKIYFGEGQIEKLGPAILPYGRKMLLVYGKGSIKKNGIFNAVTEELKKHDISYVEFGGVDPNPRITTVRQGADICKKESVDFILAVGGGSSIDCSKGIAIAAKYQGDPWNFYTYKEHPKEALPIGSVLTLSATGSEMNNGSVITNMEEGLKNGYGMELMYPKFSILDPTYTYTVPKHQTACGIVDILTHVYEFYFTNKKAVLTDRISEAVMKTVIEYGPIAIEKPDHYEARANLMWASSMALNGMTTLGKDFDGFNHGVEHTLSALYDITHADGLAILAPHWMKYILSDQTAPKLADFGRHVWGLSGENDMDVANKAIEAVIDFYKSLDMPLTLSQVDIDESRLDEMIDKAFWGETIGEFVPLTKEDVKNILVMAL